MDLLKNNTYYISEHRLDELNVYLLKNNTYYISEHPLDEFYVEFTE
jgi:hypothetical protein